MGAVKLQEKADRFLYMGMGGWRRRIITLLTGIWSDPWGLDFFDLDFLTILTAYLFLACGQVWGRAFSRWGRVF